MSGVGGGYRVALKSGAVVKVVNKLFQAVLRYVMESGNGQGQHYLNVLNL